MKQRIKIGDIVEILTQKGVAYAQFSHYHSLKPNNWGALLRILPGFFSMPPEFNELVKKEETFITFFPLQAAVNRNLVKVVANAEVPADAQKFPLFRCAVRNPTTGEVGPWWLWDGVKEWKVGKLTDEQLDLPLRVIPSFPTLVEDIEQGWTPRRDEEFVAKARAKSAQAGSKSQKAKAIEEMRHYLIFEEEKAATLAAERISNLGLKAGVTDLGEGWGVNVLQPDLSEEEIEKTRNLLEDLAGEFGGEYDGSQVKLTD